MLMGSFNSQEDQEEEEEIELELDQDQDQQAASSTMRDLEIYGQHQRPSSNISQCDPAPQNALHIRQLLIRSADLISHSDFPAARSLLSILSANSSPYGDATERLVHHFAKALIFLHLNNNNSMAAATPTSTTITIRPRAMENHHHHHLNHHHHHHHHEVHAVHSCYLTLNQITPFIRFCHLTANQAILDATDQGQQSLHILDLDIMHGLQWPPFMQALAERPSPPMLRLTATGTDLSLLRRTGDRLLRFAHSLGLRFQFHPLHYHNDHDLPHLLLSPSSSLVLFSDEALAVNCVLFLHRLLNDNNSNGQFVQVFLNTIKALNPKVVTIAEREANLNHHYPLSFMPTFVEALNHYAAIFDSLEATLPPSSRDRLAVEQIWLGTEILDVLAADSHRRRAQRYESWEVMLGRSGFSNVGLSPFALSQAKLLLRLHYPSEGYRLHILNHSFFLGWQNRLLFSVSSWH